MIVDDRYPHVSINYLTYDPSLFALRSRLLVVSSLATRIRCFESSYSSLVSHVKVFVPHVGRTHQVRIHKYTVVTSRHVTLSASRRYLATEELHELSVILPGMRGSVSTEDVCGPVLLVLLGASVMFYSSECLVPAHFRAIRVLESNSHE